MVSIPATSDCIGHGHHQSSITESIPRYSGHHTARPKMAHPPTHSTLYHVMASALDHLVQ